MGALALEAETAVRALRRGGRHAAILHCVVAAYTSAPEAKTDSASPISACVIDNLGASVRLALALMELRRRFGSGLADAGARSGPVSQS